MQPWEWKDQYLLNLIYKELQLLEEQNNETKINYNNSSINSLQLIIFDISD